MITRRMLFATLLAAAALGAGPTAWAQQTGQAEGEVRRVDAETGKVTIRHGPITGGLDMPAMTMVYHVKDPALLKSLKPGMKVRFTMTDEQGAFVLKSVEPVK